ncbi:MAG: nitroreductase family protein [Erysipelotrichaceae bacterium]|nr:nitroreductase family protein [Erysipelotrichaceae bacterium]
MEFQQVIENRRSVRKYLDKSVSDEDLNKVLEAAILAPSWKNSQVSRYYVAKSREMVEKVYHCLPEFNQNNVKNAPILIVTTIVLDRSGYNKDGTPSNELGNGWGYYDCGLHNMNLILKATDLGLSTLIMGIRDGKALKEVFNIPDNQSVVSVISLGYGDIEPQMPKRKTIEDIAVIK